MVRSLRDRYEEILISLGYIIKTCTFYNIRGFYHSGYTVINKNTNNKVNTPSLEDFIKNNHPEIII